MILYRNKDFNVWTSDIETLKGLITFGFYNPDTEEWKIFEISEFKNDLYSFVKFYNSSNIDYVVGYNFLEFDSQVIEYILEHYEEWHNLSNLQICSKIYQYAQTVITNREYGAFLDYREEYLSVRVIDVFTILGLNNQARYTSLKACAFHLDLEVEEMPISHTKEVFTEQEVSDVISYMQNDILVTYEVLKVVLGKTELKAYKGVNQLELRDDILEEFGLNCYNFSDIKIGDELLKISYAQEIKKTVKDLPKKGTFRKDINLKYCIPKYVEFKTDFFKNMLKEAKATSIKQNEKYEKEFTYKNTQYVIGLGGAHSVNSNEIWEADDNNILIDLDVASLYPALIVNNSYYPYHLGKQLLNVYKSLYQRRIDLKPQSKTDKKIKGICDAIKLILNSAYGKMGSMDSWMFDKQVQVSVCLSGQYSLLMLTEAFEEEGIKVFMLNTDGLTVKCPKDKEAKLKEICSKWEETTNLILERVDYKKMIFSTVNDYLAITTDGKVKTKGDFETFSELWKNKSKGIIALALQEYFVKGIKPEVFIKNHKNLYDFCIRQKSSRNFNYELVDKDGNKEVLKKLIRYFIAKDGKRLFKVKNENCDTNAAKVSNVEAPDENGFQPLVYYMNGTPNNPESLLQLIDFEYYIDKAEKIICKIENRKFKSVRIEEKQLSLF